MIDQAINIISWVFIYGGVFFIFTGSLGLLRMPDFFSRLHPAGITDSMGAPVLLTGLAIQNGWSLFSGKIFLLILFLFLTGPTATNALSKAAVLSGLKPWKKEK